MNLNIEGTGGNATMMIDFTPDGLKQGILVCSIGDGETGPLVHTHGFVVWRTIQCSDYDDYIRRSNGYGMEEGIFVMFMYDSLQGNILS